MRTYSITPEDFGLKRAALADIKGGDVFENARIVRRVLEGEGGARAACVCCGRPGRAVAYFARAY